MAGLIFQHLAEKRLGYAILAIASVGKTLVVKLLCAADIRSPPFRRCRKYTAFGLKN